MTETLRPTDPPEVEAALWDGWTGNVAYDVGAHLGENFKFFERLGFTYVVALEPQAESYTRMRESFGGDKSPFAKIHFLRKAASQRTGHVELAEVPGAMAKGELVTPGTDGMEWSPEDWDAADKRFVPCVTLDRLADLYGWPHLIAVDTEGHEVSVLMGGTEVLGRREAGWVIEFHTPGNMESCRSILGGFGYEVEVVRHPHYAPHTRMWYQHGWLRGSPPKGMS